MFLAEKSQINLLYLIRGKQIKHPDRFSMPVGVLLYSVENSHLQIIKHLCIEVQLIYQITYHIS
jgi:hypothetical protein